MTARRAYQPRRSPQAALKELRKDAGTQFDVRVVDGLEAIWRRGELPLNEAAPSTLAGLLTEGSAAS